MSVLYVTESRDYVNLTLLIKYYGYLSFPLLIQFCSIVSLFIDFIVVKLIIEYGTET